MVLEDLVDPLFLLAILLFLLVLLFLLLVLGLAIVAEGLDNLHFKLFFLFLLDRGLTGHGGVHVDVADIQIIC